ncbi:MAG: phenylalanine--tRNA ligase subunit alpha [Candidatus Marinimicrobia bacterium]|nr:phenylalanine--tRNA ligase subunit alpha [Candidatus Neomarinimicrobiota bacterium]|tara:strand:+ start:1205 stop:2227 length:1023 start_codon:yes stop_codon:yes gene_type:complete
MSLNEKIQSISEAFLKDKNDFNSGLITFEELKNKYLSRKGLLSELYPLLNDIPDSDKPVFGKKINSVKNEISYEINQLIDDENSSSDSSFSIDSTMPGLDKLSGSIHPLTKIIEEIKSIFSRIGFSTIYGPEVDTDYYNFEALNIPKDHPARDMQDTFYIDKETLLRTHTSSSQIHFMEKNQPPIRVISPGRVYRNEDISVRSYCLFHQIEGLYIDKNVKFSDLKGTLDYFAKNLFGENVKTRFRPSYFPFTEPSAEMDVSCIFCNGKGCNICKYSGWLEILGCGMVDPEVFKFVNYDSDLWSGFAFGVGIERIAMLKYGVKDIRMFYSGDVQFLKQFKL